MSSIAQRATPPPTSSPIRQNHLPSNARKIPKQLLLNCQQSVGAQPTRVFWCVCIYVYRLPATSSKQISREIINGYPDKQMYGLACYGHSSAAGARVRPQHAPGGEQEAKLEDEEELEEEERQEDIGGDARLTQQALALGTAPPSPWKHTTRGIVY